MLKLKKFEAYARMTKLFGPWSTWGRAHHLAYGLIRGVPYAAMERTANDSPWATSYIEALWKLGGWPEHPYPEDHPAWKPTPPAVTREAAGLVAWVKKEPRVRKTDEAAE